MHITPIGWREWVRQLWQWRSQLARSSRFPAAVVWLGVLIPTPGWTRWGSAQVVGRSFRTKWCFPLVVLWAVIALLEMTAMVTTALTRSVAIFVVGGALILVGTMNLGPLAVAWRSSRHWDRVDVWTDNLVRDPDAVPGVGARFSKTRIVRLFELDHNVRSVGFRVGSSHLVEYWAAVYPDAGRVGKVFRVCRRSTTGG